MKPQPWVLRCHKKLYKNYWDPVQHSEQLSYEATAIRRRSIFVDPSMQLKTVQKLLGSGAALQTIVLWRHSCSENFHFSGSLDATVIAIWGSALTKRSRKPQVLGAGQRLMNLMNPLVLNCYLQLWLHDSVGKCAALVTQGHEFESCKCLNLLLSFPFKIIWTAYITTKIVLQRYLTV